ncbi:MAG: amidohydrolase [Bacteroidota bacterium]
MELNLSIIQTDLSWEDKTTNLNHFSKKINELPSSAEIVILPEMFTTGFSMNPEKFSENMDGPSVQWMKETAGQHNIILSGSLIIEQDGVYFNRSITTFPDGRLYTYDKRHLFRMGEENKHYTGGDRRMIFTYKNWRIFPLICYDLRFPVWSRNRGDYDLLFYVANWPESRRHVWKSLLIARALENQVYVAGINRIGSDGRDLTYSGDSMIIDPKGQIISTTEPYVEASETVTLSLSELNKFREKFPVGKDADKFELKNYTDANYKG